MILPTLDITIATFSINRLLNFPMVLCYHEHHTESSINYSEVALALFTLVLAVAAIVQIIDIRTFKKTNQVQSIENNIINQIQFHYKILERIEGTEKDFFKKIYEDKLRGYYGIPPAPDARTKILEAYSNLDIDYGHQLRHYFRNLYRIFKYINEIDEKKFNDFDKKKYAKLVRAQLSEYEILLLFYNCIWVEDGFKFKKLVVKYSLLEGMSVQKLFEIDEHYELYSDDEYNAYGDEI
ncbi:MAG TPA: putative phage abortive infection protein [Bacteroidia bacterium]|nr:putative phage abortive infection protein [Bacteroidia bacterium]